MKSFLLRISQDKVKKDALDDCKILDYTEDVDEQLSDLDNEIMDVIEDESDKGATIAVTEEPTTMVETTSTQITTTNTETTTTSTTSTTEGERKIQVKGSRSAEFIGDYDGIDDGVDDSDDEPVSTEAAERLHSRTSLSSSSPASIHSVIVLVSIYSYLTLL